MPACMLAGMPAGMVADMPGSFIGETSAKIFPKSTGEDEVAFVQGTAPGASTSGDGLPGKTGEMRELEIIDIFGGGDSPVPTGVMPGGACPNTGPDWGAQADEPNDAAAAD